MAIPAQVEEAAELAEQLHNQLSNNEAPEDTDPAPEDDIESFDDEETVPHDDDVAELRKFKDRYMHLKGKYDAEVPRLSAELRELKQSVFEKLSQAAQTQRQEPVEEEPDFISSFSETYGEDFADNLKKLIALEAQKLTQPMQQQVASVEDTQVKVAQSNFETYIDQNINSDRDKPVDWRSMWSGKDPKFIEFLQQPDPSGLYTMGQLAEMYNQNWDADKLVSIFKLYEQQTQPAQQVTTKPKLDSPQKQAMVAPSRTNTHTAPTSSEKKVWNESMIEEFQRMDRQGKYSAEDSKALWDDLLSALGENRIR